MVTATEATEALALPALLGGQRLRPLSAWDRLAALTAREWPRSLPLLTALAAWAEREEEELELPLLLLRPEEAAAARSLLREMDSLGVARLVAADEGMEVVRLRLAEREAREWLRRGWRQRLAGLVALEGLGEGWQGLTGARMELEEGREEELDVVAWNGRGALWVCCLLDLSLSGAQRAGRLGEMLGLERALLCLLPPNRAERVRAERVFGGPVLTLPEFCGWAAGYSRHEGDEDAV